MLRQGRVAVLVSRVPSIWGSCKVISPNLEKAYRMALGARARFHEYSPEMGPAEIWRLATDVEAAKPSRIVFIDHQPQPVPLIIALKERYGARGLPPLTVHVYGDFTIYTHWWRGAAKVLEGERITFVCASTRQRDLVSRFFRSPEGSLALCPFPTDAAHYRPDARLSAEWRRKLKLGRNDCAILYTGRMSLQKNVLRLAREVQAFTEASCIPVKLLLAGVFDDLGAPLFGITPPTFSFFQQFQAFLRELPPDARKRVVYLGNFPSWDLPGLYNAADLYASLSLHHDEDFGLAPAEALLCGTPTLLTDWGGYATFADHPLCSSVPVRMGRYAWVTASGAIRRALLKATFAHPLPHVQRVALSRSFAPKLSIEAAARNIVAISAREAPPFEGFTRLFERLARSYEFSAGVPYPAGPRPGTFYQEIYGPYATTQA